MRSILRKLKVARSLFYRVPFGTVQWGWAELWVSVRLPLTGAVRRGSFGRRLADAVRIRVGRKYAVPVARGRDALWLALRCLDAGPDDEVVIPSYICRTVREAVVMAGAKPVYADLGRGLHVTAATIAAVLTPRTRCVIVPHLYGECAPIGEIEALLRQRNIILIDDAAQGFGGRCAGRELGSFGEFGVVGGGAGKAIATPAGAVLLMDSLEYYDRARGIELAEESSGRILRRLAEFWIYRRFRKATTVFEYIQDSRGWFKPADPHPHAIANLDAALMCLQLGRVREQADRRMRNARRLAEALIPLGWQVLTDFSEDALALKLTLLLPPSGPDLRHVIRTLAGAGIECEAGYAPCHAQTDSCCPVTSELWTRVLCMPVEIAFPRPQRLAGVLETLAVAC